MPMRQQLASHRHQPCTQPCNTDASEACKSKPYLLASRYWQAVSPCLPQLSLPPATGLCHATYNAHTSMQPTSRRYLQPTSNLPPTTIQPRSIHGTRHARYTAIPQPSTLHRHTSAMHATPHIPHATPHIPQPSTLHRTYLTLHRTYLTLPA